eukprot:CAMPEP_0198491464 /NCGR_PEP_ID=MMETSP1462-20131121/2799_1 /TAXON_ID=1333877 /ORGANISM="Brandtodinium nutriculum, Strain RCC3387" /LENGTH=31 /DNA_ID= /DNA_START= /DNA_END= /DNA_ORIENTATION=
MARAQGVKVDRQAFLIQLHGPVVIALRVEDR